MTAALDAEALDAILAPIAGEKAVGADLRQDFAPTSVYFRLRDARAEARDAERQADTQGGEEGLAALWRPVQALAITALKENTKDLEVATWLTEALVRLHGLGGLASGAAIVGGLVERYWDDVFPLPDEDGMETRLAAVAGLSGQGFDGTLMQPLRKIVLFSRPDTSPFTFWQFEASRDLAGVDDAERRAQRIAAGTLPYDDAEKEARVAGAAHWAALRADVRETMAAWEEMGRKLDEKAGADSPSGNNVRGVLEKMLDFCRLFAPAEDEAQGDDAAAAGTPAEAGAAAGTATGAASGPIAGREQALRQLGEIATWFRRNEPHSPIAYTLEEAVRRGRMSWPDLVAELIPDETARNALLTSLGIKPAVSDQ